MAKKKSSTRAAPAKLTYEQAIEELEAINRRIEEGEIGLEESLAEFKRGMALARRCREILDTAEQEIEEIRAEDLEEED
ncbi:MAG: exodeoxyribonuclease VII small subunit [Planctomycetota bacterium]|jgi:exodeoxyribonuclease VII small subunit